MGEYRIEKFLKNYHRKSFGRCNRGGFNEDYIFIGKVVRAQLVVLIKAMKAVKQNTISIEDLQELLSSAKDTYNLELATKIQLG